PALAPAIASAAAVVFLFCSTAFGVVLVLGGTRIRTLETEMYLQVNQFLDLRAAAVLALIQLVFVSATLAVAAWARRRRDVAHGGKRIDGTRLAARGDVPAVVAILTVLAVLLVTPMLALVERSLRTRDGHGFDHYLALLEPPARSV